MITYSRVGAKVWRELSHSDPTLGRELRQQELERLNVEIQQWYDTVPDDVKIRNWQQQENLTFEPSYDIQRLRIWTYLRLNQVSFYFLFFSGRLCQIKQRLTLVVRFASGCTRRFCTVQQASWSTGQRHTAW